jgi:hypothetical protein
MEDLKAKHEHLLEQAIDCDLISRLATDKEKRDLFRKLAADLRSMAKEIEAEIASRVAKPPQVGAHAPPSFRGMDGANGSGQRRGP